MCALVHDIGDTLASFNHPDIAVAILKPFVCEANLWMVEHHGILQGYYFFHHLGMDRDMREAFRGHPHFERTEEFCRRYDHGNIYCAGDCAQIRNGRVFTGKALANLAWPTFASTSIQTMIFDTKVRVANDPAGAARRLLASEKSPTAARTTPSR